ncbi:MULTISPECIES: ImmA/IrrE family metallo-endopeptidase [unclassified Leptospira]|uniref:helix-turn-helix domain-containing protein n=1 Tax=unclassified Leptospira TaxID=2633828 RepID=UPI0002BFCB07|nr:MULTISPECIES: XRE family transcriptional regulator [unclassified Leptospira]EMK01214.1 PF06114 domain protein [Leptospira sp. B5-022]MCR1795668.1 XRE family transcriptional regulator [Leptospira sp. id769339]
MNEVFQGKRLTSIREARGYTMRQLARQLQVTVTAVQAWESGRSQPIKENILSLSNLLNVPLTYFYKPVNEQKRVSSNVFFRSRANARLVQKKMATRRIEWLLELIDILSEYIILPEVKIFDICDGNRYDYSPFEIEQIAQDARTVLRLAGNRPIENITSLCESAGIIVSQFMIANSLDGFSLLANFSNDLRPLILADTIKDSPGRLRFSIAHELGHLFLHRNLSDRFVFEKQHKEIETQANLFAAAFLMPLESFTERVHFYGTTMEDIIRLKKEWRVSITAIIHRMSDLKLIKDEYTKRLYQRLSYHGYRKKEPGDDYIPYEEPTLFNLAFEIMRENDIDPIKIIRERMSISGRDIDDLIGKDFFGKEFYRQALDKVVPINFFQNSKN